MTRLLLIPLCVGCAARGARPALPPPLPIAAEVLAELAASEPALAEQLERLVADVAAGPPTQHGGTTPWRGTPWERCAAHGGAFHHPFAYAVSYGTPPELSWIGSPADAWLQPGESSDTGRIELSADRTGTWSHAAQLPALGAGTYWAHVALEEEGGVACAPFDVITTQPPPSGCDSLDKPQHHTVCRLLELVNEARFWEVDTLVRGLGADQAEALRIARYVYDVHGRSMP